MLTNSLLESKQQNFKPTKINDFVWNIHAMVLVEHQVCDI